MTLRTIGFLIVAVFVPLAFATNASAQIDIRGEINGRITTDDGKAVRRVRVMVMDLTTLETYDVISNDFGYYRVPNLQFGNTFLVGVKSKNHYFSIPFQNVTLNLLTREVMFTATKFPPPSIADAGIDEPLVMTSKEP